MVLPAVANPRLLVVNVIWTIGKILHSFPLHTLHTVCARDAAYDGMGWRRREEGLVKRS